MFQNLELNLSNIIYNLNRNDTAPKENPQVLDEDSQDKVDTDAKSDAPAEEIYVLNISKRAGKWMKKHKTEWAGCDTNYWDDCQVSPYHLGRTCDEYQEFLFAKCKFCQTQLESVAQYLDFKATCQSDECQEKAKEFWNEIHQCKHPCYGFINEEKWLPWIHPDCVAEDPALTLDQNTDTDCAIWGFEKITEQPSVQLDCKHIFHVDCISEIIRRRYNGPRINFNFKACPNWKQDIDDSYHPDLKDKIDEVSKLQEIVKSKACERSKFEGLEDEDRVTDPASIYYNKVEEYALHRYCYYLWYECKIPYFGGLNDCAGGVADNEFDEKELVWGKWASKNLDGKATCEKHQEEYIEFKCRFCCNIALWFCGGTTHFCEPCHSNSKNRNRKCPGPDKWELKMPHPDWGHEFALGCGLCRKQLFWEDS